LHISDFCIHGEQKGLPKQRDIKGTAIIFIAYGCPAQSVLLLTFVTRHKSKCPPHRRALFKIIAEQESGKDVLLNIEKRCMHQKASARRTSEHSLKSS